MKKHNKQQESQQTSILQAFQNHQGALRRFISRIVQRRAPEIRAMLLPEQIKGELFVKADNLLPIAGSIKARGGIYAVLVIAEKIAIAEGLIEAGDDFELFATDEGRALFA